MNNILTHAKDLHVTAPAAFAELVRGNDQRFIGQFCPLVTECNLIIDMTAVQRIDAAGIAALISLYGCAREAGNTFHVSRVNPRVEEILQLVGLDHILVTSDAGRPTAPPPVRMECPAA
jgi:anti-anti-sigma factor